MTAGDLPEKALKEENARLRRELARLESLVPPAGSAELLRSLGGELRAFIDVSALGLYIVREGTLAYVNPAFAVLAGRAPAELMGRKFSELVAPADQDMIRQRLSARQCGAEVPAQVRFRLAAADGALRWVLCHEVASPFDGSAAILGTSVDVTAWVETDRRLEASEEKYRSLVESAGEAIFTVDREGVFLFMNREAARQLGGVPEDFVGHTQWEVFPRPLADRQMNAIREVFDTGQGFSREVPTSMRGLDCLHHTTGVAVRDPDGRIISVLCIARDVTALAAARSALTASQEKYVRLVQNLPVGVFRRSVDGRLTEANDALARMYGFSSVEELLSAPDGHFVVDDATKVSLERTLAETGQLRDFEVEVRRKDGSTFWISLNARANYDRDGRLVSVDGVETDITQRKQAEAAIRLQSLVLDQIKDHVSITDLDGVITYVNQAVAETHRRGKSEFLGRPTTVYGEDASKGATQREIFEKTMRDDNWHGEVINYAGDGSELVMDCRTQVVRDETGKPIALFGIASNITARKKAERALVESEQLFRALAESAPAAIAIMQGDKIIYANEYLLQATGATREEVEGADFWNLFGPEVRDRVRQFAMARQRGETVPDNYEVRIVTRSGESKWALFSGRKILYQGKPAALGLAVDITERKKMEEQLRQSEANLSAILENSSECILLSDEQARPIYFNSAYATVVKELLGLDIKPGFQPHTLLTDVSQRVFWEDCHRRVLSGERFVAEQVFTPPGGSPRYFEHSFYPIVEAGRIKGFSEVTREVTARRKAEETLRESEEKFRRIAERSYDTILLVDMSGMIRYASPSVRQIAGYLAEDVVGRHLSEFIAPGYMSVIGRGLARLAEGKPVEGLEFEIISAYNVVKFVEANAVPIIRDDRVVSFQTVIHDTTDRRRAEKMLQDAHEEQSRQLRQVAGGLAHDVYNDLFPVATSLYKLRQMLEENANLDKERSLRLLTLSEDAIGRAVRLTEFVNLYSRMQKDKNGASASIAGVLTDVLDHNRDRLNGLNVKIKAQIPGELSVGLSSHQLHPLLNNLLLNALDALGGVSRRVIEVSARREGERVLLQFSDSGSGIPPDVLPRVFEPFFSTKPNTGTGLGLAIVKRIAEISGGSVNVVSSLDSGTTFSILLPYDAGSPE